MNQSKPQQRARRGRAVNTDEAVHGRNNKLYYYFRARVVMRAMKIRRATTDLPRGPAAGGVAPEDADAVHRARSLHHAADAM